MKAQNIFWYVIAVWAGVHFSGCATVDVVEVCSQGKCATGYYDETGDVVTAAHPFIDGTEAIVRTRAGYSTKGIVETEPNDVARVTTVDKHLDGQCSADVAVGDKVTVSTLGGPVRTHVTRIEPQRFFVAKRGITHGDSGAPVTVGRCIVGAIYGQDSRGVIARYR